MELKPRNINAGHRERMREKFVRGGVDSFLNHEILEMLLFYPILYKDTNPISHLLIEKFGSFSAVMSASVDELCESDGIGEQTALFIKAVSEIGTRVFSRSEKDVICLDEYQLLGKYAVACMCDETESCACLVMLNNRYELIRTVRIEENLYPGEDLPLKFIAQQAMLNNASMVALVSHRIDKSLRPSKIEIENTYHLLVQLEELGVKLLEHYNVCGAQFFGYSKVLPAILSDKPKYELFYRTYPGKGGSRVV